uniref:Uncharacterized protein n=1 Tax=Cacopsylla melanoneura TaxID=428564 RepID=A0A8D8ZB42_9HEMI
MVMMDGRRGQESLCSNFLSKIGNLVAFLDQKLALPRDQVTTDFQNLTFKRHNPSGDRFDSLEQSGQHVFLVIEQLVTFLFVMFITMHGVFVMFGFIPIPMVVLVTMMTATMTAMRRTA